MTHTIPTRKLSENQAAIVRAELTAIQSSDSFSSSKRCRDFLCFIVERALVEDYESLSERFLGVELFGRAIDYETATDSIVRVRANDVRRRLCQYYSSQRTPGPVRINLVAGGYVPDFHWTVVNTSATIFGLENAQPAEQVTYLNAVEEQGSRVLIEEDDQASMGRKAPPRARVIIWAGGVVALILVAAFSLMLHPRRTNFDRFWQPVLNAPSSPVLSLPTSDTFQLTLDSMRTLGRLNQLEPGETLKIGPSDVVSFHDWHVSLPVLQATLSVAFALERNGKIPIVRVGTDLRRDEIRGHPVIAIGSFSNPWVKHDVSGLRFTFDRGASDRAYPRIRDAFNPQRSWTLIHTYPEAQDKDYAIVTRTFDPSTHEPFVSLAGLHSFGNQIAAEFVSQDSSWNELARRAPLGWDKMNLQIVLEADVIGTTPGSPRILAVYFWR